MAGWTDDEVFKLIEIWNEDGIQEQLEGSKRNKHVYEKLCTQLRGAGYVRTGEQCRSKVKKLRRQQYKKIKDNNGMTGRGRGKWRFFDALDEVFGHRPATRPPVIFDTTDDQQSTDIVMPPIVLLVNQLHLHQQVRMSTTQLKRKILTLMVRRPARPLFQALTTVLCQLVVHPLPLIALLMAQALLLITQSLVLITQALATQALVLMVTQVQALVLVTQVQALVLHLTTVKLARRIKRRQERREKPEKSN